jgi:putative aminopeptidase FrvX
MNAKQRTGSTLLEVAIGSMMMAVLLIPAIHAMNDSDRLNKRHDLRISMLFAAEEQLEKTKISLLDPVAFDAAYIASGASTVQSITLAGTSGLVCRTQIIADKSIGVAPARLVTIVTEVWQDINGDRQYDNGEPSERLLTQQAKL